MNIVIVIDDLRPGGSQRQMVTLARNFSDRGDFVHVVFYCPNYHYASFLQKHHVSLTHLNSRSNLERILTFRKFIRENNPDVVISFLGIPSFLSELASIPKKKWILIAGERSANPVIFKSFKGRFIRLFHFFADFVVSNSHENISMIRKVNPFLNKAKLRVIYNSIDLERFVPNENYLFKKDGKLKIIVPASYRKLKNPIGLIRALSLLSVYERNYLVIDWFGEKIYDSHRDNVLKECEELIDQHQLHESIRLHNINENIDSLMQNYDAVGLFSFHEGLPNAICEGMACGKVILSSTVSDIPGFISEGKNGFLFNPKNVSEIVSALRRIIATDPAILKLMGKKNRIIAEKLFKNQVNFNEYIKLIETGKRER
jgi:glycosyltransferase involved in cell wall biosynthesis